MHVTLPFALRTSYDTEPFYKAAHEEHKYMLQKCKVCGKYYAPAAFVCQFCGSTDVEWVEVSGHGKIYAYVETRFAFHKGIKEFLPIGICSVTLDEGPRVFGRLINYGEIEKVPYDAPVHVVWLTDDEKNCTIPAFELDK